MIAAAAADQASPTAGGLIALGLLLIVIAAIAATHLVRIRWRRWRAEGVAAMRARVEDEAAAGRRREHDAMMRDLAARQVAVRSTVDDPGRGRTIARARVLTPEERAIAAEAQWLADLGSLVYIPETWER